MKILITKCVEGKGNPLLEWMERKYLLGLWAANTRNGRSSVHCCWRNVTETLELYKLGNAYQQWLRLHTTLLLKKPAPSQREVVESKGFIAPAVFAEMKGENYLNKPSPPLAIRSRTTPSFVTDYFRNESGNASPTLFLSNLLTIKQCDHKFMLNLKIDLPRKEGVISFWTE